MRLAAQAADSANKTLNAGQAGVLLAVMIGGSLVAGIIIAITRSKQRSSTGETQSVVRSWLAVTLVLGLLSACAAAFEIDDAQLRNTLLGGLVASTGAATAFYFSSKGSDAARADILKTTTTLAQGGVAPSHFSALAPPAPTAGTPYLYTFLADGTPPVAFELGSGALPTGLDLDSAGHLQGTPTTAGETATFTVIARNGFSPPLHSTPVTLVVQAAG